MNLEDILRKCLLKNKQSEELLYNHFAPRMNALVLRYIDDADDALDVLQQGFITMFQQLHQYRGQGSFEGWLRRIMITTALQHLRNNKKLHLIRIADVNDQPDLYELDTEPLETLSVAEIKQAMNELPPGYKLILNMIIVDSLSHQQVAQTLGISESTSRSQLAKARRSLQKILLKKIFLHEKYTVRVGQ